MKRYLLYNAEGKRQYILSIIKVLAVALAGLSWQNLLVYQVVAFMLLIAGWGPAHEKESQYLRVFIAQLRKKIEADLNRPTLNINRISAGYRFY